MGCGSWFFVMFMAGAALHYGLGLSDTLSLIGSIAAATAAAMAFNAIDDA